MPYSLIIFLIQKTLIYKRIVVGRDNTSMVGDNNIIKFKYNKI
jgi:hypothetical protein